MKILIILLFGIIGCKKTDSDAIEKRIAEKTAKHVIEKDSLNMCKYSGEVLLHIKSEKLNEKNYKTYVTLNGLKSKSTEFKTEKLNINGFETIIYYSESKTDLCLPNSFFVPDYKSWNFLSEIIENDIILSQLKLELSNEKNGIEELNEIDF
ncbi:hypothetical protein [Olleya sp. HaHaR_3_96]|uniref:hypothetical protein n=1 Tax=Olleya sp. HaHaR_3_96 TaxID=2745560 RepID=UPI001C4FBF77|nr:hypothetical protein [Olleya sp. HaHaR_3_96]QXP59632.1 hypothetical protein H0I26_17215 [Olleya sp. HaHaR_3_96]